LRIRTDGRTPTPESLARRSWNKVSRSDEKTDPVSRSDSTESQVAPHWDEPCPKDSTALAPSSHPSGPEGARRCREAHLQVGPSHVGRLLAPYGVRDRESS
jgi:hypothetical protein